MKKLSLLLLLIPVFFLSCKGIDGNSYLKYYWTSPLSYMTDSNPSTPHNVYNDVYFSTNSGTYYMTYGGTGFNYYMYYTIEVDEGGLFTDGDDLWFGAALSPRGPTFYKLTYDRSVDSEDFGNEISLNNGPVQKIKADSEKIRGPILGREEKIMRNGTIRMEYGQLLDGET